MNISKSQPLTSILIVDDNPKNLQVLGKALQVEDYGIEFATDGATALEWLDNGIFDLVLLDINMPGMDGFEVCRKIRSDSYFDNIPIIFLTAETDRNSILKGFEAGAQDYVTKPFDSKELVMRAKTHIALKKSRESLEELNRSLEEKVLKRTRQLNEAMKKAEASDRLKTAFLNNISHEIRTPLNGIIGFGQLIISPKLTNEDKKNYLEILNLNCNRLLETITNYMDISLIVSGCQMVSTGKMDARKLINDLYEIYRTECETKNIELIIDNPGGPGEIILESDYELLMKAISHLLNNSLKFTEKGSITLGYESNGESICFYVKDSGTGIDKDAQDLIFQLFMQEDISNTRPFEGSGIGLSIAKGLAELLGGKIDFKSVKNEGATFFITLPFAEEEEEKEIVNRFLT